MKTAEKKLTAIFGVALITVMALSSTAYAIKNGQPDGDAHPYVGLLVFDVWNGTHDVPAWRCTGSLLSSTVVLCAGHCTYGASRARIWFDEVVQGNPEYPFSGDTSYDGIPYPNPDYRLYPGPDNGLPSFSYRDVGIVVLTEPVPTSVVSEYAELPDAGEVDRLQVMTDVDLVGYGVQTLNVGGGQPFWSGLRNRFNASAKLIASNFVHSDEFVRLTANPGQGKGGTTFGDSGGPVLLAGTKTILAVNSYVTNYNCAGVTYHSRVDIPEVLEWINTFLD